MKRFLQWPAWVWGAILAPRMILFMLTLFNQDACLLPDSYKYLALAENLWGHFRFTQSAAPPWIPEIFRVPGYSLFLAPFTALPFSPVLWIAFAQCAVGAAAALLAGAWLREMSDERGARAGVLILALDPLLIFHTPMILAETLVHFFTVLALFLTWRALTAEDPASTTGRITTGGLAWGMTTLIKPVFLFFPLLIGGLWVHRKKRALVFLVAAYLLPAGWILRNGIQTHFWGLTTQAGFDLLKYPAAGVEALHSGRPVTDVQTELVQRVDAKNPGGYPNEAAQSHVYRQSASAILKNYPLLTLRYCATGALRMLAGTGTSLWLAFIPGIPSSSGGWSLDVVGKHTQMLFKAHPWLVPVQFVYAGFLLTLYCLSITGWIRLWRLNRKREAWLLATGVIYLLAISSHQGISRFRIPMMPFLAASFACALIKK